MFVCFFEKKCVFESFKRSESNELVENLTCLDALEGKIWKSDQNVVMDDKFTQKFVMEEESVQNDVDAKSF